MAEVVGLVASIIQIAGAGTKLSSALYHFTTSAVRADQDITDIASDVELTSNALESVGKVFETEDAKSIVSKKAIQDANSIIKRCEAVFADISELVEKRRKTSKDGKKSVSVMGKLSWPMKEQRVELHRRRLESLKNSLVLLLHVLQLAQGQAHGQLQKETLEQEREKIRELHQRQQDSLKCLQALETKLGNVVLDDEEAPQGPNDPSQIPTLGLMSIPGGPPSSIEDSNNQTRKNLDALAFLTQNSDISDSETTFTDDEDEHLSLEELAKAAKHVQKLLKRITKLQHTFDATHKTKTHGKKRVHRIYQRFCRSWEQQIPHPPRPPLPPRPPHEGMPFHYLYAQAEHGSRPVASPWQYRSGVRDSPPPPPPPPPPPIVTDRMAPSFYKSPLNERPPTYPSRPAHPLGQRVSSATDTSIRVQTPPIASNTSISLNPSVLNPQLPSPPSPSKFMLAYDRTSNEEIPTAPVPDHNRSLHASARHSIFPPESDSHPYTKETKKMNRAGDDVREVKERLQDFSGLGINVEDHESQDEQSSSDDESHIAPHPPVSPDSRRTDPTLPKLPAGWIAQWDNRSRKYYYVQISTGVSQWDLPTSEGPIGGSSSHSTPAQNVNPYNKPDGTSGPDAGDGTRGMGGHGESTDRAGGLGGFAMNALMGNNKQSHGGSSGSGNLVGQLAGSLLGGVKQSHGGSSGHGGGGSGNLVGQLAGSFLGGGKQSHGGSSGQQQHGGSNPTHPAVARHYRASSIGAIRKRSCSLSSGFQGRSRYNKGRNSYNTALPGALQGRGGYNRDAHSSALTMALQGWGSNNHSVQSTPAATPRGFQGRGAYNQKLLGELYGRGGYNQNMPGEIQGGYNAELPGAYQGQDGSNDRDGYNGRDGYNDGATTDETPSASIAPWAKEPPEAARGPSLRMIQEAEAKKAGNEPSPDGGSPSKESPREIIGNSVPGAPEAPAMMPTTSGAVPNITPQQMSLLTPSQVAQMRYQLINAQLAGISRRYEGTSAAPTPSYPSVPPPASQPYYTAQPPRRGSSRVAYQYEPSLASYAPHPQAPTTSGAAEAREREEAAALLRQQLQDTSYYKTRSGGTSNYARDSLNPDTPHPILDRTNSHRRTSIVQPTPPSINTQVAQRYSLPSARTRGAPPVSFPTNFNPRPTSSPRRPSFSSQDQPFIENHFMTTASAPAIVHQDPWGARNMRDALRTPRQIVDDRYTKVSGSHGAGAPGYHSAPLQPPLPMLTRPMDPSAEEMYFTSVPGRPQKYRHSARMAQRNCRSTKRKLVRPESSSPSIGIDPKRRRLGSHLHEYNEPIPDGNATLKEDNVKDIVDILLEEWTVVSS